MGDFFRRVWCELHGRIASQTITPEPETVCDWRAMRELAKGFQGEPGVVLHLGDSITRDPAYAVYATGGIGRTVEEVSVCAWMRAGERSRRDGWFLATGEHDFARTAFNGITAQDFLDGRISGIKLSKVVEVYRPQVAVVMFGTNEATRFVRPEDHRRSLEMIVEILASLFCIPILSTVPPHYKRLRLVTYNEGIRTLAVERKIPCIDLFSEMARRRPRDWNGSLMGRHDVHPSAGKVEGPATEENLRASGYLLRSWLSLRAIMDVKKNILEPAGMA
jgi:hypothetical protein